MKQQTCKFVLEDGTKCGSVFHTAMYHKPKTPIKRTGQLYAASSTNSDKNTIYFTVKKSRKKRTPRAKAKDAAWAAFSLFIRMRDSLATTGTIEACVCITCNERGESEPKDFKHIQAGHAIGGRKSSILFHEEVTNGQCNYCNAQGKFGLSGDYGNYAAALIKKYGLDHYRELQALARTTVQYKTNDFIEIKQRYDHKVEELLLTIA